MAIRAWVRCASPLEIVCWMLISDLPSTFEHTAATDHACEGSCVFETFWICRPGASHGAALAIQGVL